MKLKGVLAMVFEPVTIKGFERRNFVVEYNDRERTEYIYFELFRDHCKLVDLFKIGDKIVVDFSLRGRKWTNAEGVEKYFNTLQAWKISYNTNPED